MIRESLLAYIDIPVGNVHTIPTYLPSPRESAELYEGELRDFFPGFTGFDLVLLGVGEDGHTASLFPGSNALLEKERLTAAVMLDTSYHDRVTLTLPAINGGLNIIFLVCGNRKAAIVKRILNDNDQMFPASMVKSLNGKVIFALDRDAARNIEDKI